VVTRYALLAMLLGCRGFPVVTGEADAGPACEVGTACDGVCRDLATDLAHCGACGRACGAGELCDEGACAPRIVGLSAGYFHTCARTEAGEVWCWGRNDDGQASTEGESLGVFRPTRVAEIPPLRLVAADETHTCGISEGEGEVWCWGGNRNGGCDVSSSEVNCRRPVRIPQVRGAGALCLGNFASCATGENGAVRCWGSNNWGGLGDGRAGGAQPSTVLDLDGITHLGCGWGHVCARRDDGTVWCWGANSDGQLGHNRPGSITSVWPRPVMVSDLEDAAGIVATEGSNCAWNAEGTLRCWGGNDRGNLGDGTLAGRWAPVTTLPAGVESVWSGRQNVFARLGDGALLGWGAGVEGNLGAESSGTLTRPTPVFAAVAPAVREVVAGRGHTCILLEGGRVRCLGEGRYGQLGDGRSGVRETGFTRPRWATE
jgi:alpha-tubulin suppressor-like RCC1 family protein